MYRASMIQHTVPASMIPAPPTCLAGLSLLVTYRHLGPDLVHGCKLLFLNLVPTLLYVFKYLKFQRCLTLYTSALLRNVFFGLPSQDISFSIGRKELANVINFVKMKKASFVRSESAMTVSLTSINWTYHIRCKPSEKHRKEESDRNTKIVRALPCEIKTPAHHLWNCQISWNVPWCNWK